MSSFGFFYGLSVMPLVNALTLGYTAPLMMTALSAIFLGDRGGFSCLPPDFMAAAADGPASRGRSRPDLPLAGQEYCCR